MEVTKEHTKTRKRLENVAVEDIWQGNEINTSLGTEIILDTSGSAIVRDLFFRTITEWDDGDLLESKYYFVDENKDGSVYMHTYSKGSAEYKAAMRRKRELGIK